MYRKVDMGEVKSVCIRQLNMEQPQRKSLNLEIYWEKERGIKSWWFTCSIYPGKFQNDLKLEDENVCPPLSYFF